VPVLLVVAVILVHDLYTSLGPSRGIFHFPNLSDMFAASQPDDDLRWVASIFIVGAFVFFGVALYVLKLGIVMVVEYIRKD